MKVYLNSEEISIESNSLIDALKVKSLEDKKGIAVALNESIIPKANWTSTELNPNEKILAITATQGG